MRTVIALTGLPGAGKSEVRNELVGYYGFTPVRISTPIKEMCHALGLDWRHTEGAFKERPADELAGATPRKLMQVLGREVPDALGIPHLWGANWVRRASASGASRIVVDDHRYANEVPFFRAIGHTQVWQINRTDHAPDAGTMTHQAENQELSWDLQVWNGGTLEALRKNVAYIMEDLFGH